MPVEPSNDDRLPVESGTNVQQVIKVLVDHPDTTFAPREIVELTGVR
jgi:hypothetical protein